jgi:hypothetical protein
METEIRRFCGAIMVMRMALAEIYVAYLSLAIAALVTAKSHKKAPETGAVIVLMMLCYTADANPGIAAEIFPASPAPPVALTNESSVATAVSI